MPLINNLESYLAKLETLPPFQKPLSDIPNEAYKLDVLDINESLNIGGKSIQLIGSLNIGPRIFVFNDPEDNTRDEEEDEHDIVQNKATEEEVLVVPNYDSHAIIQYGIGVSIKAGVPLEQLGFSLSGSAKVRACTYKLHPREHSLLKAATHDLKKFPWIFSLNELKNLKNNEVCTLEFAGELSSALEVSWSDLYSGSLMGISKIMKSASPIALEVDAGATVRFDFGIQDHFVLVIKRVSGSEFQVGVKKNKKQSLGASAQIGISASLAEKDHGVLEKVLDGLLEQYLQKAKAEINKVLAKANMQDLNAEQLETVEKMAEMVGLGPVSNKFMEVKQRWESFLERLRNTIAQFVKAKIELGVSYEYSQIRTENCFMVGTLSESALENYHADLIKFKLKDLLKDKSDGVVIKKFLQEKGYQRKRGFGFDLKVAQKGIGIDHDSSIEILERYNEQIGFLHLVTKSDKSYEGEFFGETFKWTAGLQAETKGFVYSPKISDLSCQLHLGFEWSENKKLEEGEIKKIADTAVLWGLIKDYRRDLLIDKLTHELKNKSATDIHVALKIDIPDDAFNSIIRAIDEVKRRSMDNYYSIFSHALAACMFSGNSTVEQRIATHGQNFLLYLKNPHLDHPTLKAYGSQINMNHINHLNSAIDILVSRGGESCAPETVKKIIRGFNQFHNNIYRVKVLGFLMFHYARIIRQDEEIETALKISYQKGNQEKVINVVRDFR
ncbi:hypothetical protein IFO69_12055 [Echinicola sp. CAU 1574]|uniref:Uncharacterized protein n=1 Tax=Echinicola arenosa TaxID=2774144 RepID=A0ABR9AKY8_9BACT|nr:hypothetical protein [Echinicola arenosa]MBD8489479.1 hypothetical protein [Echinicola arenosa]